MPLEYEYVFRNYDKNYIIKEIKKMNGKKFGHFIFRVIVFNHPDKNNLSYIRIRDEGHKITMTVKTKSANTQFSNEHEIIIDNYEAAEKILYLLGCTKKYYYEKIREIWNVNDVEIIFDKNPGYPEIMEIETSTKKKLDTMIEKLNIKDFIIDLATVKPISEELFGFLIPKNIDLTFNNVKKELSKYIKKNKKLFLQYVNENKEIYDKLYKK